MIVPIGLKTDANKEIIFSANAKNFPNGIHVYLEDRLLNTFTRLDEVNSTYRVTLTDTTHGTGRFYVHSSSNALSTSSEILNSVSIYKTDTNMLRMAGLKKGNTSVTIFNSLGKQVLVKTFNTNGVKEIYLPTLASVVYIM